MFTVEEWPVQEPASFEDLSIGEEQSASTVTAISWSPSGLAKHRRPILAVLTSNLILSCWASNSNPAVSTDWHRVIVINNAVQKWWDQIGLLKQKRAPTEVRMRRKVRVRSMSWAPRACPPPEKRDQSFETKKSAFLLAVANDDGDLSFLLLSSPYTHMSTSWNCTVIKIMNISGDALTFLPAALADAQKTRLPDIEGLSHIQMSREELGEMRDRIQFHPSLFKSALAGKRSIDHIAWGPWKFGDIGETIVTFSRDGTFFHCLFEVQLQVPEKISYPEVVRLDFKRFVRQESDCLPFGSCSATWHSQNEDGEPYVAFGREGKIHLLSWIRATSDLLPWRDGPYRLKPDDDRWGDSKARNFTKTYEPWDRLTGTAFCSHTGEPAAYLYLSTQLSHIEVLKITRDIHDHRGTGLTCEPLSPSPLERQMIKLRNRVDRQEELGGLCNMKTWGLAAFGGYIAAFVTLHPGDMAEYYIASQERATIVFSSHGMSGPGSKRDFFPWETEAKSEDSAVIQSAILDSVLGYEQHEKFRCSKLSNRIIYAAIMASALTWDSARSERLRLAENAARRLSRLGEVDLSSEIECLSMLLSGTQDPSSAKAHVKQATGRRSKEELSSPASRGLFDICTFCEKAVAWESLTEATCMAGHPFTRCSLTFLAILEPGICKFCSGCNRAFLNEDPTCISCSATAATTATTSNISPVNHTDNDDDDDDNEDDNNEEQRLSLADMLFETYDTCPYCRGKFRE